MNARLFPLLALAITPPLMAGFDIKPTVLRPDTGPFLVPALEIGYKYETENKENLRKYFETQVILDSTLTGQPERNDEPSKFDARLGYTWKPKQKDDGVVSGQPLPTKQSTDKFELPSGQFYAEIATGFETDEAFDNHQLTSGILLHYSQNTVDSNTSTHWNWQLVYPSITLDYRRIYSVSSTLETAFNQTIEDYWRFGAIIDWQVSVQQIFGTGAPKGLKLIPAYQYHKATDSANLVGDYSDAHQYSIHVDWTLPLDWEIGSFQPAKYVSNILIGYSKGRVPPMTDDRERWSVALTMHWGEMSKLVTNSFK